MTDLVINGALISLLVVVVGGTVKLMMFLSRMKEDLAAQLKGHADLLIARLGEQEKAHQTRMAQLEREHQEELGRLSREFGETVSAIRQKIHEIETWSRDEFVRKGSFETVITRMEKGMESLGDKIEKRLDKMAERIEKIGQD